MNKRKMGLAPIEDPREPADSKTMTEEDTLDQYMEADFNDKKEEFKDIEKEQLEKNILDLREEIENLKSENARLKSITENQTGNSQTNAVSCDSDLENRIEKLDYENDELILKNSELEFEIAKLKEENSRLQSNIETLNYTKAISKHPTNHTCVVRNNYTFVNNGYRDWR